MNGLRKQSLISFGLFVGMVAFGIAAVFGDYQLGVDSSRLDGAANTISGVVMIGIGLSEGRRHGTALLRLWRA